MRKTTLLAGTSFLAKMAGCLFLILGTAGCGNSKVDLDQYINNKYEDSFTYSSTESSSLDGSGVKMIFDSQSYPDADVCVAAYQKKDSVAYCDNYMAIVLHDDATQTILNLASQVYGDTISIRCEIPSTPLPVEMDSSTTLDEYLADIGNNLYVELLLPYGSCDPQSLEADLTQLGTLQKENKVHFWTRIFYLKEDCTLSDAIEKSTRELSDLCTAKVSYSLDSDWNVTDITK